MGVSATCETNPRRSQTLRASSPRPPSTRLPRAHFSLPSSNLPPFILLSFLHYLCPPFNLSFTLFTSPSSSSSFSSLALRARLSLLPRSFVSIPFASHLRLSIMEHSLSSLSLNGLRSPSTTHPATFLPLLLFLLLASLSLSCTSLLTLLTLHRNTLPTFKNTMIYSQPWM